MYKCVFSVSVTIITLITATVPEDICESCVHLSKCPLFASMDRTEQQSWMQKYPCHNHHPDDYGTPPGSRANQGNFICCPNQVWGVEPKKGSPSRLTDVNKGNFLDTNGVLSDQNNSGANNDGFVNSERKQRDLEDGMNRNTPGLYAPTNIESSRWPANRNRYWNSRPDTNGWDIGNPYFYHGNNNRRFLNNNGRNNYDSNQRNGRNNIYNNQGIRRYQPDDRNYSQYPYYPSKRQPGNSFGKEGQCDRLTSFPPDPQSGCCGREASDDDRIIDAPNYNIDYNAPTFNDRNNNNWQPEEYPDYGWSLFKEDVNNVTLNNNTVNAVNGTKDVTVENRISGGKATELTQYPWTVLLVATFENGFQQSAFNCGGSLISPRYVLTAGHCVYDAESVIKSVEVFLAEFDKRTFPLDCKITAEGRKCVDNIVIYSENVIRHPRFDEIRLQNDIALIKLKKDAPYTEYIRPICLPSINIDNPEHNRLPFTVAGWGRNGQYKSDVKQSTTVHLVPQHDCRRFYPDLTPRHLCAAGYTGQDTCKGDSGGPLMVLYRGKYYVVGVVSGKRTDAPCGSTVPSLYTNVYHYLDWIRDNIKS